MKAQPLSAVEIAEIEDAAFQREALNRREALRQLREEAGRREYDRLHQFVLSEYPHTCPSVAGCLVYIAVPDVALWMIDLLPGCESPEYPGTEDVAREVYGELLYQESDGCYMDGSVVWQSRRGRLWRDLLAKHGAVLQAILAEARR